MSTSSSSSSSTSRDPIQSENVEANRPVPGNNLDETDRKRRSSDTDEKVSDKKRSRTQSQDETPLDTAKALGYKPGDRIEVRWELSDDASEKTEVRWWGATLLEHDGRTTEDGVAIRVLDYDPCEEWGYHERSLESVLFGNEFFLINPETLDQLFYRKEGEDSIIGLGEDDLREELNDMLVGILQKHKTLWQGLDAAKQAQIGELMAHGKEAIIATIQSRFVQESKPIAAADIPSILQEAFAGLKKDRM